MLRPNILGELMENTDFVHAARRNSTITLKGLPAGITEEQVADYLWQKIGINVLPEHISLAPHDTPWSTVIFTRETLADWLTRAFALCEPLDGCRPRAFPSPFPRS